MSEDEEDTIKEWVLAYDEGDDFPIGFIQVDFKGLKRNKPLKWGN